jgi:hypothetical protein
LRLNTEGLYSYKVIREGSQIFLRFIVSKQMIAKVEQRLELNASSACRLSPPTWGVTSPKVSQQVECPHQRTAQEALEMIQFAFAFFSERTVKIGTDAPNSV